MTDGGREIQVIILGDRSSYLSSSSVHAIATGQAHLRIDSSALDRLTAASPPPQSLKRRRIPNPTSQTPIESRAALVVLVNKLLRHSYPSTIRPVLPNLIADALNSDSGQAVSLEVELTEEEGSAVDNSCAELYGVSAIIDHQAAVLATIVDVVAAMSCEALNGNDSAFNVTDAGDGLIDENELAVARDMKVLLSGRSIARKIPIEAISEIPEVHGGLRQFVKSVHTMMKVKLNSAARGGEKIERKAAASKLGHMIALRYVGASSLSRAKLNIEALGIECSRNSPVTLFEMKCPTESDLKKAAGLVLFLLFDDRDDSSFDHALYCLVEMVWSIVSWEVVMAFAVLQPGELEGAKISAGDKTEKAVLGKGATVIVKFIKERLRRKEREGATVLESLVDDLLFVFKPSHPEFVKLVSKVRDIVEKLPEGAQHHPLYKPLNKAEIEALMKAKPKDMDWFTTIEEQNIFFAVKALESYNRGNLDGELTMVEAISSNRVSSCVPVHVHVNFTAKDKDGTVHLVFAETTFGDDPILVSFCILDRGEAGDYSHHQKGCGYCDPKDHIPLYHPFDGGFKYGKSPYHRFPPFPPRIERDMPEVVRKHYRNNPNRRYLPVHMQIYMKEGYGEM